MPEFSGMRGFEWASMINCVVRNNHKEYDVIRCSPPINKTLDTLQECGLLYRLEKRCLGKTAYVFQTEEDAAHAQIIIPFP